MTPYNNHQKNYQKTQIETSKPEKLISMLMEGAIRFLQLAKEEKVSTDIWKYRLNLLKAQQMLLELVASLNFEQGGEIAVSLHRLYIYMIDKLSTSLEEKNHDAVTEVINLLIPLKETWNEAVTKFQSENTVNTTSQRLASGEIKA